MIRLVNTDCDAYIGLKISRDDAESITREGGLAPGWRFVEEVEIMPSVNGAICFPSGDVVAEIKQEAPKTAKKPRAKARKVKESTPAACEIVRSRLSVANGAPKSFAELAGPPLNDSAIRNALEAMRAAGEVVVTGQKRGTKYQLVAATAPAAS